MTDPMLERDPVLAEIVHRLAQACQPEREVLREPLDRYVREGKKLRFLAGTDFHLTELDLLDALSDPPTALCKAYALPPNTNRACRRRQVALYHEPQELLDLRRPRAMGRRTMGTQTD